MRMTRLLQRFNIRDKSSFFFNRNEAHEGGGAGALVHGPTREVVDHDLDALLLERLPGARGTDLATLSARRGGGSRVWSNEAIRNRINQ